MTTVRFDTNSKDADHIMSLIEGKAYSEVIKAACELELFDELAKGPRTAAEIAEPKDWSTRALEKLLSICAAMKLVEKAKRGENEYEYKLLGPGRQLLKNGPPSLWGIGSFGGVSNHCEKLADQVKKTIPNPEIFDEDAWEPEVSMFWMMEGFGLCYMKALLGTIDCSQYKTAVDLGAGSGVAGVVLCQNNPQMKVTLVDKEKILELAKNHFVPAELKERVTYLPGDMFKLDLPKADMFLACRVVLHLSEEKLKELLKILMDKLSPGGCVAFVDSLVNENADGPLLSCAWDIVEGLTPEIDLRRGSFYIRVLQEMGFVNVKVTETQDLCVYNLITGMKPQ